MSGSPETPDEAGPGPGGRAPGGHAPGSAGAESAADPLAAPDGTPSAIEMGGLVLQPGDFVDMYRYERPIGRGGMAYVLLARDPSGQPVALKVLKASRVRTGLARFRREFRALSRLNHPNIIRVESWGDLHGHPYLAMEYVEGADLHSAIRRMMRRSPEARHAWIEDVLSQLARALGHLARRGLVHRDLKPSNILIDADGTCKLTDFGIVKDLDPSRDPLVSTTLVGTWAYASPEQIGGDPIDHRSDLYSLGVILYAMLTGRRPFVAETMAEYLELHRHRAPVPPSQVLPEVSPLLERICLRLLAKSPRDRFQAAGEILEELRLEEPETNPEPEGDRMGFQPPLIGRAAQLDQGREILAALTRRQGGVLLLEGAEGSGRTRLLGELVGQARQQGFPVFETRLLPNEGSFEALLRLAREVGKELGGQVPPELPRAIARFAQGRGRLPGDARYQLYDGVRAALDRLLLAGPLVLALDDLHLAPPALLDLLGYLVRTVVARDGQPLLVLAALRREAPRSEPPAPGSLAAFRLGLDLGLRPELLSLDPLGPAHLEELVGSLLGPGPAATALATQLLERTGGEPLYVVETLRGMIQKGLIARRAQGGHGLTVSLAELQAEHLAMPPGLRQLLQARLSGLDAEVRAALDHLAVAGGELELDVLLDLLELSPEEPDPLADEATVMDELPAGLPPDGPPALVVQHSPDRYLDAIDRALEAGLLVEERAAAGGRVRLAQRQVAEVLYDDLPEAQRAALHRRIAAALRLRHPDSPLVAEAVGEHYRRAGESGLAWRFLTQAAVGLMERALLGEAEGLVQRAREAQAQGAAGLEPGEQEAIETALMQVEAELWTNRGEWGRAEPALAELAQRLRAAGRVSEADEARVGRGVILRRQGEARRGEELLREVLVAARRRHDRRVELRALHALAGAAWAEGDLEGCERLASQALIGAQGPEMAEGRAGILLALTAVQASKGQLALAVAGLSEAEELLRSLREKKTRASVLCNLSEVLCWRGELLAAEARAEEARLLARGVAYRVVEASALRCRALARLELGDLAAAARDLEDARELAQRMALVEEEVPIRFLLGRLELKRGDPLAAEMHLAAAATAACLADPERYAPGIATQLARAQAERGRVDAARASLLRGEQGADQLHAPRRTELLLMRASVWRVLGDGPRALALARQGVELAERYELRTWEMHGHSLVAVLAEDGAEAERARERGAGLARAMLAHLSPERVPLFRRQASVLRLLGPPLA